MLGPPFGFTLRDARWRRESPTRTAVLFCAIVALSFLLRGTALGRPDTYYFDEVYYVYTAQLLARGDPAGWEWWHENPEGFAIEWTHPPLAKLAIAQSIRWFGDQPVAWRLPGALAASLASGVMFLLGVILFRSSFWGLVAAGLFSFDLLPLAQARIATPEAFLYLFTLLVFLSAAGFARAPRLPWLLALGTSSGLLLATKWNGIVALGLAALLAAGSLARAVREGRWRVGPALLAGGGFLVFLPLAVYLLSFVPFFASGHTLETFKGLHQQMYWYHSRLDATHPYQSRFWEWPLVFRSIWYYTAGEPGTDRVANIYALGNPAIWWPGAAAMLWLAVRSLSSLFWRRRGPTRTFFSRRVTGDTTGGPPPSASSPAPARRGWTMPSGGGEEWQDPLPAVLVAAYLLLWLPYALSPRVMFLYHYLPASVIMMLGIVAALRGVGGSRSGRMAVVGYLVVVALAFVYFHPVAAGTFISRTAQDARLWLPGWR